MALVKFPHLIENIEHEDFEIERSDGMTIMPQFWELLADPNSNFNIVFGAPSLPNDSSTSSTSSSSLMPRRHKKGKRKSLPPPLLPPPPPPGLTPPPPAPATTVGVNQLDTGGSDGTNVGDDSQPLKEPRTVKPKPSTYDYRFRYTVQFLQADKYGNTSLWAKESFEEPIKFGESEKENTITPVVEEHVDLIRSFKSGTEELLIRPKLSKIPHLPLPPPTFNPGDRAAIVYPGDRIEKRRLIVQSTLLLNAIRAVVKYSAEAPSGNSDCFEDGEFPFPYKDLIYHKEELKYKISHPTRSRHSDEYNAECDRHIDVLIKFLYNVRDIQLKEAEDRWNMKQPSTTFSSLWLLLKAGSDVYVFENGQYNAYVVESFTGGPFGQEYAEPYRVRIWNLCYDGSRISRQDRRVIIPVFDGEREIRSLPLFPIKFYLDEPGKPTMREQLIMRGRTYFELSKGPAFREYHGRGLGSGTRNVGTPQLIKFPGTLLK